MDDDRFTSRTIRIKRCQDQTDKGGATRSGIALGARKERKTIKLKYLIAKRGSLVPFPVSRSLCPYRAGSLAEFEMLNSKYA